MKKIFTLTLLVEMAFISVALASDFQAKEIYQETSKAVVLITARDSGQKHASMGTGSIIRSDGIVITNTHVIFSEKTDQPLGDIRAYLKPERLTGNIKEDSARMYKATLLAYNQKLDLAILKIQGLNPAIALPCLRFANPDIVSIGDPVLAIGHPENAGLWTLTTGTISGQKQDYQGTPGKNVFQTETSINRGNSGGPLIDSNGNMVAINSNMYRRAADGLAVTGINFSIKSSVAVDWLKTKGYEFAYAETPKQPEVRHATSGIVPVPAPINQAIERAPISEAEKKVVAPQPPRVLTKLRPFKIEDLFRETEAELEDMMKDMSIRK